MTKRRIPLAQADQLANEVAALLFDDETVERWDVAGSTRRRRPEVSDIELVCLSRFVPATQDMFGNVVTWRAPLESRVESLQRSLRLEPRTKRDGTLTMGPKCKLLWYYPELDQDTRFKVDLFIVHNPMQYGLILAIRTGSAEFSQLLVTNRPPFGNGLLPLGWKVDEGWLTNVRRERQDTSTEDDLFALLGLETIPPEERDQFAAEWRRAHP